MGVPLVPAALFDAPWPLIVAAAGASPCGARACASCRQDVVGAAEDLPREATPSAPRWSAWTAGSGDRRGRTCRCWRLPSYFGAATLFALKKYPYEQDAAAMILLRRLLALSGCSVVFLRVVELPRPLPRHCSRTFGVETAESEALIRLGACWSWVASSPWCRQPTSRSTQIAGDGHRRRSTVLMPGSSRPTGTP